MEKSSESRLVELNPKLQEVVRDIIPEGEVIEYLLKLDEGKSLFAYGITKQFLFNANIHPNGQIINYALIKQCSIFKITLDAVISKELSQDFVTVTVRSKNQEKIFFHFSRDDDFRNSFEKIIYEKVQLVKNAKEERLLSPLERMKHLESIREFITNEEFETKRKEIIDGI
jgi:hypothetical protein